MKIKNAKTNPQPTKEPSPHQMLRLLKTKAWTWSCAYSLSESTEPLKGYSLSKAADRFLVQNNRADTNDPKAWDYRLKGKQSASETTVDTLWPHLKNIYKIGPWAGDTVVPTDHKNPAYMQGGYVPLWAVLEGNVEKILEAWNNVELKEWEEWLVFYKWGNEKILDLLPTHFDNGIELYKFITHLTNNNNIPPILALAANVTITRLMGSDKTYLFDKSAENNHSLNFEMRENLLQDLSILHLKLEDIIGVANAFDLEIVAWSGVYMIKHLYSGELNFHRRQRHYRDNKQWG